MKIKVGQKLKDLRLSAELTQAELADRAQLTKGFISQLENDLVSISLESLNYILEALGVSLQDFFEENSEQEQIVFGLNDRIPVSGKGASVFDLLAPGSTNFEMNPMFVTLEPGEALEEEEAHVGEEFGYVLEGSLTVQFGKESKCAKKRHCFYFESNQPHRLLNESGKKVSFIWVTSPPLI